MVSLEQAQQELQTLELQVESVKTSYHDVREVEISIIRIGSALQKLTGSPQVQEALNRLNKVIWTIRSLQMMIHALEIAEGPIGWLYFAATALSSAVMIGESFYQGTVGR